MKQQHLARLAAFLVGATGAVAFGDHHGTGSLPDCSFAPAHCTAECASLYNCLASPTGGFVECASESSAYESCRRLPPPIGPGNPGGIIILPPSCPPGQHFNAQGQCQADHECEADEIGGGSEECQACGDGQVPNEGKSACVTCEDWGEHPLQPGRCRCDAQSLDALARSHMGNIPDEPWERGGWFACGADDPSVSSKTYSTEHATERCSFEHPVADGIGKAAGFHTHPVFVWNKDKGLMCSGKTIETQGDVLTENAKGLGHSSTDMNHAKAWGIPSYLADSARSLLVYRQDAEGEWEEVPVP